MRRALPMAQYCRFLILQAVSCYREAMHWAAGRPWLRGLQSEYDDPVPVDEIEDFIMPALKWLGHMNVHRFFLFKTGFHMLLFLKLDFCVQKNLSQLFGVQKISEVEFPRWSAVA